MAQTVNPNDQLRNETGFTHPDAVLAQYMRQYGLDPDYGYLGHQALGRYSKMLPTLMDVLSIAPGGGATSAGDARARTLAGFGDFVAKFAQALSTPGMSLETAFGVPNLRDTLRGALTSDYGRSYVADLGDQAPSWLADFASMVDSLYGLTPAFARGRQASREREIRSMLGDLVMGRRADVLPEDWISIALRGL